MRAAMRMRHLDTPRAALIAGALAAACGAGPSSPPTGGRAPGRVLVSEIMYHPPLVDSAVEKHEFVELHNAGGAAHRGRH